MLKVTFLPVEEREAWGFEERIQPKKLGQNNQACWLTAQLGIDQEGHEFLCSHGFSFCGFSYPQSTAVWKYYMENSRTKQSISFKLLPVLSSVVKSHAIPLWPARDVNHPFVHHVLPVSHLVAHLVSRWPVFVLKWSLFYLVMAPKCTSSDVGSLDMPKTSGEVLPLSEKVKVLDFRKEKKAICWGG